MFFHICRHERLHEQNKSTEKTMQGHTEIFVEAPVESLHQLKEEYKFC